MERQVFERGYGRMSIKRLMSVTLLSAALVVPAGFAPARAGTLTGGATEWTQVMNNVQLVLSYVKQVKTVENTLRSARYLKQNLKQLDPSTLARLTGQPIDQVRKLVDMDNQLREIMRSGNASVEVLQRALKDGSRLGITPQEYLKRRAQLAQVQGGTYAKAYENDQQKLKNLNSQMAQLQSTAASIPSVSSQIDGLQQLLAQGTQTQAQLLSLNAAITKANALASRKARLNNYDLRAARKISNQDDDHLKNIEVSVPDPTKIDITSDGAGN